MYLAERLVISVEYEWQSFLLEFRPPNTARHYIYTKMTSWISSISSCLRSSCSEKVSNAHKVVDLAPLE